MSPENRNLNTPSKSLHVKFTDKDKYSSTVQAWVADSKYLHRSLYRVK